MIDAFASENHYASHLANVWHAIPTAERGTFAVPTGGLRDWLATKHGIDALVGFLSEKPTLTLVAAWRDFQWVSETRPLALLEHGAGQTYAGDSNGTAHPMYAGGTQRERVAVFLTPREEVADRNRARYPQAHHAVVGSPFLDPWLNGQRQRVPSGLTVVSSHWNGGPTVECHSAWWEYRLAIRQAAVQVPIAKHAHPRAEAEIQACDVTVDIPYLADFDTVLDTASVYVVDNSSTAFEAAAVGCPVVLLNASFYRRGVSHGLRFWSQIPGPQVDTPADLYPPIRHALDNQEMWSTYARTVAEKAYDVMDGTSSRRAAEACLERVA